LLVPLDLRKKCYCSFVTGRVLEEGGSGFSVYWKQGKRSLFCVDSAPGVAFRNVDSIPGLIGVSRGHPNRCTHGGLACDNNFAIDTSQIVVSCRWSPERSVERPRRNALQTSGIHFVAWLSSTNASPMRNRLGPQCHASGSDRHLPESRGACQHSVLG
jgi:hypothetical protein